MTVKRIMPAKTDSLCYSKRRGEGGGGGGGGGVALITVAVALALFVTVKRITLAKTVSHLGLF